MSGPVLFDRRCNLFVATASGNGFDLGELHVKFKITRTDIQSCNWADITVYNLKDDTARQIRKEFTRLVLQAGYKDAFGVIFDGSIRQVRIGRENGTDSFISIAAADGDQAYNFATVHKTIAAGATLEQQAKAALEPMSAHGVTGGFFDNLGGPKLPRGKVMFGMSRDYLRHASRNGGATWSIQNGKVQIIKRTGLLPGQAFNLTSSSGLIGTPTQTDKGIEARHLIHPDLRIGAAVKIDESLILEKQLDAPTKSGSSSKKSDEAGAEIAADGRYRVYIVEYQGDNRDNDWYADLTCLGANQSAPNGKEVSPQ